MPSRSTTKFMAIQFLTCTCISPLVPAETHSRIARLTRAPSFIRSTGLVILRTFASSSLRPLLGECRSDNRIERTQVALFGAARLRRCAAYSVSRGVDDGDEVLSVCAIAYPYG